MTNIINYRRRGGLRFVAVGRLNISWSIKRKPVVAPLAIEDWQVSPATEAQAQASFQALREALN